MFLKSAESAGIKISLLKTIVYLCTFTLKKCRKSAGKCAKSAGIYKAVFLSF
jgi:hypothetical protein